LSLQGKTPPVFVVSNGWKANTGRGALRHIIIPAVLKLYHDSCML